jgi:hypothetical protein
MKPLFVPMVHVNKKCITGILLYWLRIMDILRIFSVPVILFRLLFYYLFL